MATQLSLDFEPPLVRTHTFWTRRSIAPTGYMRHSRSVIEPPDPSPLDARIAVSGHCEPWLRESAQCDGGSWWCAPRSERIGASANRDFPIRGVSSMARLAG